MAKSRKTGLVTNDGKHPKKTRARRNSFTRAKQADFIAALAETCNVSEAARIAGVSQQYVYEYRKKDAGFYSAWLEAVSEGHERLDLVLLERSIHGQDEEVWYRGEPKGTKRVVPERTALTVYKAHLETAKKVALATRETPAQKRDWLAAKLLEMRKRLAAEKAKKKDTNEDPDQDPGKDTGSDDDRDDDRDDA